MISGANFLFMSNFNYHFVTAAHAQMEVTGSFQMIKLTSSIAISCSKKNRRKTKICVTKIYINQAPDLMNISHCQKLLHQIAIQMNQSQIVPNSPTADHKSRPRYN